MKIWRLLVGEPMDGASNMALDEALLLARARDMAPPTVRFFSWFPPAVSIGYGQRLDARVNVVACRRLGVDVVRRPTGGSAIYHDTREREVTYSVVASAADFEEAHDLLLTYRWIGEALATGLQSLGAGAELVPVVKEREPTAPPAFCFARTGSYEIEARGRKLVGSAQRRQAGAFLQHGSVLLGADAQRLRLLFPGEEDPLAGMTTLEAELGRRPNFDEAVAALAAAFRECHALVLSPGGLLPHEQRLMEWLAREKYATDAWTRDARPPADRGAPLSVS